MGTAAKSGEGDCHFRTAVRVERWLTKHRGEEVTTRDIYRGLNLARTAVMGEPMEILVEHRVVRQIGETRWAVNPKLVADETDDG